MSYVLRFNYLVSTEDLGHATELLKDKYPNAFNEHMVKQYFGCPTEIGPSLGGRCMGLPGQVGSNQGGERRGGIVKEHHARIVRWCPREERSNMIHLMTAVAVDIQTTLPAKDFAWQPVRDATDYGLARIISDHDKGNLVPEALYMICKDSAGDIIRPSDVLGHENECFKIYMPTSSRLYTTINQIWEGRNSMASSIPYYQQMESNTHLQSSKSMKGCNIILGHMTDEDKKMLKTSLINNLSRNTSKIHDTEDLSSYLYRRAHRNPFSKQHKSIIKQKKRLGKNTRQKKNKKDEMLDVEKWGLETGDAEADNVNKTKYTDKDKQHDESVDDISETFFGDEDNEQEIYMHVVNADRINPNDEDLLQMTEKVTRVNCFRELGDWITLTINASGQTVTCDCEDYIFRCTCCHSASFELIHFGVLPHKSHTGSNENWVNKRKDALKVLKDNYIE